MTREIRRGPRILVFDSGVGGLSIAEAIGERLPDWQLIYLADNAFFPYGDQPEAVVIERCNRLIGAVLETAPVDLIVVGCNTASTVVLPSLRAAFRCPVIGVVPAIKPAAALSRNRRIGLLATPATIRRPYLEQLIGDFAADCEIVRVGSPELAPAVEHWMESGWIAPELLAGVTRPFREAGVDAVVLGCTHFPLIRHLLAPQLPAEVTWVDSGDAIARRTEALWHAVEGAADLEGYGLTPRLLFTGAEPRGVRHYLQSKGWPESDIQDRYGALIR